MFETEQRRRKEEEERFENLQKMFENMMGKLSENTEQVKMVESRVGQVEEGLSDVNGKVVEIQIHQFDFEKDVELKFVQLDEDVSVVSKRLTRQEMQMEEQCHIVNMHARSEIDNLKQSVEIKESSRCGGKTPKLENRTAKLEGQFQQVTDEVSEKVEKLHEDYVSRLISDTVKKQEKFEERLMNQIHACGSNVVNQVWDRGKWGKGLMFASKEI